MEECKTSQKMMQFAWDTIFNVLYLAYDTAADFLPQFEKNVKALLEIGYALQEFAKEQMESMHGN